MLVPFRPRRLRAALRPLLATALVAIAGACAGGDGPSGPAPVAAVAFSSPAETLLVGESRRLALVLRDARGQPVSDAPVRWTSANPAIATVDSTGVVTARLEGETEITATANGHSATLSLAVRPLPVATVTITAPTTDITVGALVQLQVTARDSTGAVLTGRRITFGSTAPTVASVSDRGTVSGLAAGAASISAEIEGRTGTIVMRVSNVPVATVEVTPSALDLEVGRAVQLSAVPRGASGQPLVGRRVSFRSTNAAVAAVNAEGVVTALTPGTASIVAAVEGREATVPVTVVAGQAARPEPVPPPPLPTSPGDGRYTIRVSWVGTPDARAAGVVASAIGRWERVITGDLPDVAIDIPADACFDGQVAESTTVDDLLVYVRVVDIDGPNGTLARAGPCYIRNSSSLPVVGVIELDGADLDRNAALVESVLTHEFGHVLGIGTLWTRLGLLHGSSGDDPLFLGATAQAAYGDLGAGDALVPVENTGGPGTRLGHWRESVFRTELMTGWISPGLNPMSRMTIASLRDLGYRVDMNAADPYALPGPSVVSPRIAAGQAIEIVDELITPRFVVDRDGRTRRVR